jgi:hypothetical protein
MIKKLLLLLLLCVVIIQAQTTLTGNIGGNTYVPSGNPFIINDSIVIQQGKKTTVAKGCVFLFHAFSKVIVSGSLSVEGTVDSPVVFTSVYDRKYSADTSGSADTSQWNGITISPQADKIVFSNCRVHYSISGVESKKELLSARNVVIVDNVRNNFFINDIPKMAISDTVFNYEPVEKAPSPFLPPPPEKVRPAVKVKYIVPGSLALGGIAAAGVSVFAFRKMNDAAERYGNELDPTRQDEFEQTFSNFRTVGFVLAGIAAVCLPGSGVLFVMEQRQLARKATIGYRSLSGENAGLFFTMMY